MPVLPLLTRSLRALLSSSLRLVALPGLRPGRGGSSSDSESMPVCSWVLMPYKVLSSFFRELRIYLIMDFSRLSKGSSMDFSRWTMGSCIDFSR
jgi:hypothetical protein